MIHVRLLANSPEKYTIPHKINLKNEQFYIPFTSNSNNFKYDSPRIITTISHAKCAY